MTNFIKNTLYVELEQNQIAKCDKILDFSEHQNKNEDNTGKSIFEVNTYS